MKHSGDPINRKEKGKPQSAKKLLASIKEKGATWEGKPLHQKYIKKTNYASSKKLLTSIKGEAPSPEKKKAIREDQEGCGQTSQQTSAN